MRTLLTSILLLLAVTVAPATQGDTLVIDKVRQDARQNLELPTQGMTMAAVVDHYGEPREKLAAVGEPPIARWVYDGYVVYFEQDRVLHTVVQH